MTTDRFHPAPRPTALIGSISALLLVGCAVGPDYRPPAIEAPSAFMGQRAIDARRAPRRVAHPSDWWEGFRDPLMSQLILEALAQNLDLAQSVARVREARASLQSGSALRQRFSFDTPVGRVISGQPGAVRSSDTFETDLGASWEIDLVGGLRRGRESANALYQAAGVDVAAARLAVAAETADTYIAIRGLQARVEIANQQIDKQRQLLSTVKLQFSKGVAAALQVQQAEGSLAEVEATVPALFMRPRRAESGAKSYRAKASHWLS